MTTSTGNRTKRRGLRRKKFRNDLKQKMQREGRDAGERKMSVGVENLLKAKGVTQDVFDTMSMTLKRQESAPKLEGRY
ncbi:hypothetical protein Bpfe_004945 [Biomphalaria pfeifferi]|uniref:Uncharacterized protein n=1 Tax=Biomphalaria pfeifferi TaxID=112525 RepID=A0AAD8C479_BIOPF|nr:hypothetical protein Bpfe_004945 [Biomphalaria pfeifferi]